MIRKTDISNCILLFLSLFVINTVKAQSSYVDLKGKKFQINGNSFYPVTMNYIVDVVHTSNGQKYIAPHEKYFQNDGYGCHTQQDCFNQIVEDLTLLKSIGFNSIRLVGLAFGKEKYLDGSITSFPALRSLDNYGHNYIVFPIDNNYNNIFALIEQALNAAELADMKVEILVGGRQCDASDMRALYLSYLGSIAAHFANNDVLFAYDFINEPGYFDSEIYTKSDVCSMVTDWHNAVNENSPYHLTTIGLSTSSEVREWDPGILKLDFLSFHLYSNQLDVVKSEIKWISETCTLPWVIGETGFSANINEIGGQGTLLQQKEFAKGTLEMTRDCGGSGYAWWTFKDVRWGDVIWDDIGLYTRDNIAKPAVIEFQNFNPNVLGSACTKPQNYYNYNNSVDYLIEGHVKDQNNVPIKNALITGWTSDWENSASTFTDELGNFNLYSNWPMGIVSASAVGSDVYSNYNPSWYLNISLNQFHPSVQITTSPISVSNGVHKSYYASSEIISNNVIVQGNGLTGGNCTMRATERVRLLPGFHANLGSYFLAENGPIYVDCNTFSSAINDIPNNNFEYKKNYQLEETSPKLEENRFVVSPNPSNGIFNIYSSENLILQKIEVFTSLGISLKDIRCNSANVQIDLSTFPKGAYYLKIYCENEEEIEIIMIN